MSGPLLLVLVLGAAALYWVLRPLAQDVALDAPAEEAERAARESRRAEALREIAQDLAMGKITDAEAEAETKREREGA